MIPDGDNTSAVKVTLCGKGYPCSSVLRLMAGYSQYIRLVKFACYEQYELEKLKEQVVLYDSVLLGQKIQNHNVQKLKPHISVNPWSG